MSRLGNKVSRLSAGTRARQTHRTDKPADTIPGPEQPKPTKPHNKTKKAKKTKKGR